MSLQLPRCARYVILAVSLMHLTWSALLFWSASCANATPIAAIVALTGGVGHRYAAAVLLAVVAVLALLAWMPRWKRPIGFLIPQQVLLIISASAGVLAAWRGHYADGTIRPWQFILGDQLPVMIIALLYTTAIFAVCGYAGRKQ